MPGKCSTTELHFHPKFPYLVNHRPVSPELGKAVYRLPFLFKEAKGEMQAWYHWPVGEQGKVFLGEGHLRKWHDWSSLGQMAELPALAKSPRIL